MISFKAFINAIHDAILSANESLMERNTSLIDKYFESPSHEANIKQTIDEALEDSKSIYSQKDKEGQEEYKKVVQGLKYAQKALGGQESSTTEDDNDEKLGTQATGGLSAKSVIIEYPHQTKDGVKYEQVHVPLITLVPLSMSQIKEAKLTTEFELQLVDNEVQLNFDPGKSKGKKFGKKPESTFGRLEITISPQESSEGLKRIVEGYERALKAQIPH